MATVTAKLGLRKPAPADNVDVDLDIAQNMQKIDDGFAGIVAAFRNVIRNGDMGVAQRGGGAVNTSGSRTIDGWLMTFSGGANQHLRNALAVGSALTEAAWVLHTDITGQAAAGDFFYMAHAIENVRTLAGKQVTLSFLAKATAGTPKIGIEIVQNFGSGGAPSAVVNTAISAVTISAILTRYSVTFTIPSISGKSLGTNNDDSVSIFLWMSSGSTNAARASNIGIQNSSFDVTDVQLEEGSVATAFERLPQQVQLAWCQRYFYRWTSEVSNIGFLVGQATSTTGAGILVNFPVKMRAAPTFSSSGAGSFFLLNSTGGGITMSNISLQASQKSLAVISCGLPGASLTAGNATMFGSGSTTAVLDFSAEL